MIDPEKIKNRIEIVRENITELEKMKKLSAEEFSGNKRDLAAAKHFIRVAVEAMIDIASHIVAKKILGAPASATDAVNLLAEKNILPREHLGTYVKMVKYRNRLIHFYHEVTVPKIHDIIQNRLNDFYLFIQDICELFE